MELLLVDLCKDTVLKRPTPARTTTAGAVFDVPTFGLIQSNNRSMTILVRMREDHEFDQLEFDQP